MDFELERRQLRFRTPAPTSRGLLAERTLWLVRARSARGDLTCGLGECGPIPGLSRDDYPDFENRARAALHALSDAGCAIAPGASQSEINRALAPCDSHFAALPSLRFGVETALRDLACGGRRLLWESAFTRGQSNLPTHGLIWTDDAAGVLRQISAKVAAGFTVIKMKVGALEWEEELEIVRRVRGHHPGIEIRLDANGAFSVEGDDDADGALERLRQIAPSQIAFLEQPIPAGRPAAMARLCRLSPIPLALDEELIAVEDRRDAIHLLKEIQPAHLILKPALLGGFAACRAWIEACDEAGVQWWINSLLESAIGHNAIVQWAAAMATNRVHGLGTGGLFVDNFASPIALHGCLLHFNSGAIAH